MMTHWMILAALLGWFYLGVSCARVVGDSSAGAVSAAAKGEAVRVYVGSYGDKKTITLCRLDLTTGQLTIDTPVADASSPSFLAIAPNGKFLYAVNELNKFNGKHTGALQSFAIDAVSGVLTPLNQASSGGQGPCYVTVDPTGKYALTANYNNGVVAVLPIGADGKLGEPVCIVPHHGKGPDAKRQEGPHAHCVDIDPTGKFALSCDLGLDEILISHFDSTTGQLTPNDPPFAKVEPGAGPRHLAFSPDAKFVYVVTEMASTITAFTYDGQRGTLHAIQTISSVSPDATGQKWSAEIAVLPNGKFLYTSNRARDTMSLFARDIATGKLTYVTEFPADGKTPRHFALDPTGAYLIEANQDSDNIVVFRIDPANGYLKEVCNLKDIKKPVCVLPVRATVK